jgi:radical SAM protein with 4Fe4S-binding SPASM domain
VNKNFKVIISSVVHSENIQSMFELADIISGLHIHRWHITSEQAFNKTVLKRMLDVSVWNLFVDEIISRSRCRVSIRKLYDFPLFEKMEMKYGKDALGQSVIPNCGIGQAKVYIYPDFSIVPCTCMPDMVIGNLLDDSVMEIKNRLDAFRCSIETASACYVCRWNYLCNGGCPGYSYHLHGKIGFGDIRCPLVKAGA